MPHRIIFAGTPEFAVPTLQALINHPDFEVIAVFTQPDRPAGRGQKLMASPIKLVAEQHHIPVHQPLSLKDAATQQLIQDLTPDAMIVVAYGLLLPQAVLDIPKFGCINVHGSILPKWRGAAPIQRSIEAGDTITGVSIMQMEKGLDTGPVFFIKTCKILPEDTSATLFEKISQLGANALIESLPKILNGSLTSVPQDNNTATYAHKLTKEEAKIDWSLSASVLARKIRAFTPWPGSYFERKDTIIKIGSCEVVDAKPAKPGTILNIASLGITIACGEQALRIQNMQIPGGKMLPVAQLLQSPKVAALFENQSE